MAQEESPTRIIRALACNPGIIEGIVEGLEELLDDQESKSGRAKVWGCIHWLKTAEPFPSPLLSDLLILKELPKQLDDLGKMSAEPSDELLRLQARVFGVLLPLTKMTKYQFAQEQIQAVAKSVYLAEAAKAAKPTH